MITNDRVSNGGAFGASATFDVVGAAELWRGAPRTSPHFRLTQRIDAVDAHIPRRPTLTNDDHYHNKLHLKLALDGTAPDTLFAVAVSSDGWQTQRIVTADGTLGDVDATLRAEDFHTRDFWGGADGMFIRNLDADTPYSARVAALRPHMTQTTFGPASPIVRTEPLFVRMTIAQNISDFFILNTATVARATHTELRVSTNNETGYQTYIRDDGDGLVGGLFDAASGALIPSHDAVLGAGIVGYGAQASSPSAHIDARYDHSDNTVGALHVTNMPLSSNAVSVDNEPTFVNLKVSIDGATDAGHYTDTIYYTATVAL